MIKNRQTLYVVMRAGNQPNFDIVPVGAYSTLDRAEEIKGVYEQQMIDRAIPGFYFNISAVTVYDE